MAQYDLVFEGGGAKGSAFVGALTQLSAAGHTHRRLVGTSAGAITAALLGAGYTPAEMLAAVNETTTDSRGDVLPRFATFMDPPSPSTFSAQQIDESDLVGLLSTVFGGIPLVGKTVETALVKEALRVPPMSELFSLEECGGFYAGDAFLAWFKGKLADKGLSASINWKDFATATKSDVSVVTTDTKEQEMVVLNARTAPDAPVAESVRMSMSIPFVWREMQWQDTWGLYRGRSKAGNIFVDGGVLSNFPIRLVEESDAETLAIMGKTDPQAAGTIGLLLDETMPVAGAAAIQTRPPRLKLAGRVMRVIDAMMGTSDADAIRLYRDKVCHIPVGGYGTTEFRMPSEKLAKLVESGRAAMEAYLTILASKEIEAKLATVAKPKTKRASVPDKPAA